MPVRSLPAAQWKIAGVDHGVDAERGQPGAAGGGEAVQRVGAVDLAAAHHTSVRGGVPAEVADVEAAVQLHEPGRGIGIGGVRLMPGRHRAKLPGRCGRGSRRGNRRVGASEVGRRRLGTV